MPRVPAASVAFGQPPSPRAGGIRAIAGGLLVRLPHDLRRFGQITLGTPISDGPQDRGQSRSARPLPGQTAAPSSSRRDAHPSRRGGAAEVTLRASALALADSARRWSTSSAAPRYSGLALPIAGNEPLAPPRSTAQFPARRVLSRAWDQEPGCLQSRARSARRDRRGAALPPFGSLTRSHPELEI